MAKNFNWYLLKIQRISGIILLILIILFFVSGYGMTRQMISYLEIRAENPTLEQIRKFAEFFEVSADEFVFDNLSKNKHPGKKSRFEKQMGALRNLPHAQKNLVCDMIDAALKTNDNHFAAAK